MRVLLRALEVEDYKTSVFWRNDPEVWAKTGGNAFFVSSEQEKNWVENAIFDHKNDIRLAICMIKDSCYIGNVYLNSIHWINRSAEFSIFLGDKTHWGEGFGTEATLLMLKYGFDQLGLERIFLLVLEENASAIKVYQKCGFHTEGTLRRSIYKDGEFKSQILMSILKTEFKKISERHGL